MSDNAAMDARVDRWLNEAMADGMCIDDIVSAALSLAVAATIAEQSSIEAIADRVAEMMDRLPALADAMTASVGRA